MRYPVGRSGNALDPLWYNAQPFGNPTDYGFHEGDDFNLRTGGDSDLGQPLYAVANGKIVYYHNASHPASGFGRHMVLECETSRGKRWYMYSHCQEITAEAKEVKEGDIIGKLGKSGTPLAHLHFSVIKANPSTLPQGIDTIAKTSKQLNDWWEKFEILGSGVPQPMPENLEERLKKDFGVKTLDELKEVWDKEMGFLKDKREKVKRLEQELVDQKAVTKAQTEALKASQSEFSTYVDNLVEKLNPDPKLYKGVERSKIVELEIDRLIESESTLSKKNSELEKSVEKIREEKQEEIDQLRTELDSMQKKIILLSERLEQLENGSSVLPEPTPPIGRLYPIIEALENVIEWVKSIWKR